MINKKHITLFTLCAFTVASLFTNVQAAEKTELSEGMYNWFLVQAYNSACSLNGGKEGLWDNEIEGKAAEEWIEDTAILYGKEYLAGIKNGFFICRKPENRAKKIRFEWKRLGTYFVIEWELFINVFRRFLERA